MLTTTTNSYTTCNTCHKLRWLYTFTHHDGHHTYLQLHARSIFDEEGALHCLCPDHWRTYPESAIKCS